MTRNKTFCIQHTKICSINENLLNINEHSFDITAFSEILNLKNNQNFNLIRDIIGCEKLHSIEGSSLKHGCEFYIKENIKFTPKNGFIISHIDDKNKFQFCSIIILLENILCKFISICVF